MKKVKTILFVGIILVLLFSASACYWCDQYVEFLPYYSDKANYIVVIGEVSYIHYSDDASSLYIAFDNMQPMLDDNCFKIVGTNLAIVQEKGINNFLEIGSKATFVTAPKYFGDGYVMPIVAITVDDTVLLEFDEGYENLIAWFHR